MSDNAISVGIIGGSGYTAGELIRLLVHHPVVSIDFVYSTTNAKKPIADQHQDLIGELDLCFTDTINPDVSVLFLCLGHGRSRAFLEAHQFSKDTKIIDLGNDFRLEADASFQDKDFVYGLPELNLNHIQNANYIANPGCFATAIQLGILPLAKEKLLDSAIHVNATTGSTGAGVIPSATTHFSWRANNFSSYKVFTHQHLGEINQTISELQPEYNDSVFFIPNRGDFPKGIYATIYTAFDGNSQQAVDLYKDYYKDDIFTTISDKPIHLKQVVNTNKCVLHIEVKQGMILVTSVIDNLIKGASGQAIHNMNLMLGLDQKTGLGLKANFF